jgi:hypothetical protein
MTRRRKLNIGSSTDPVVCDKRDPKSKAAGLAVVRPRPRNFIRLVSNSISALDDSLATEV